MLDEIQFLTVKPHEEQPCYRYACTRVALWVATFIPYLNAYRDPPCVCRPWNKIHYCQVHADEVREAPKGYEQCKNGCCWTGYECDPCHGSSELGSMERIKR